MLVSVKLLIFVTEYLFIAILLDVGKYKYKSTVKLKEMALIPQ
jgi:hypothetical protein